MYPWLMLLHTAIKRASYTISKHAFHRMGERGVTVEDIEQCALNGDYIGSEDHGRDLKVILRGRDHSGEPFSMIAALSWPNPTIITVMREDEPAQKGNA